MRMRRKKHFDDRLQACAHLLCRRPQRPLLSPEYHFGFAGDVFLEIGCGKGSFAVQMAAAHPAVCYYAMERVGNVLINAMELAEREKENRPDNLRFIMDDADRLRDWFAPGSLSAIYLNFSDPWPKKSHSKRRLTHRRYLQLYFTLLKEGGRLYVKTDNDGLFAFTLEELEALGCRPDYRTDDLHHSPYVADNMMTEYEAHFVSEGKPIHALAITVSPYMTTRLTSEQEANID
ncbi:MAG: tRNA (guanosine(46)-N7)-methyltransferase TrmB [Eubacteriales bacterium]